MKTLGIIVTSDRYPEYLVPLTQAAHNQGVAVYIHLIGTGVRLVGGAEVERLAAMADISVCGQSASSPEVARLLADDCRIKVTARGISHLIDWCDRHVFL